MFLRELNLKVNNLQGAGPRMAAALEKAGVHTIADLLLRYPRDWEDLVRTVPLKDFERSRICTVVTILAHDWFGFGGMRTLKVYVEDDTARAVLTCYGRSSYLKNVLVVGRRFRLSGRFFYKYGEIQASQFEVEAEESGGKFGQFAPVYPLAAGLTQNQLYRFMKEALKRYAQTLDNELPAFLRERYGLLHKKDAVRAIHFPASREELELAKKTLIYEELFYLEIMVGRRALERRGPGSPASSRRVLSTKFPAGFSPLQSRLLERLPFKLTAGQQKAIGEINRDMDGEWPMARLLQGDVGSGKTLAAFFAALRAVDTRGGQAALMAPTELLARQHAENAARLLEPLGIRPAFLTGNIKAAGRKELLKSLASGDVDIVIGTHALFSKDVAYRNLRLVIVDEQHRFGVTQRSLIMEKGDKPDLLMMSATPIPRTLAFTIFGDMDVSVIPDMPPGRRPVKTHLAMEANEKKVYDFVGKELAAGRQAYFVYPLIEGDPGTAPLKDAQKMAGRLSGEIFPRYKTALLHSKVDEDEKQRVMEAFRNGDIHILAATSVVEVGVDVPNATCMVIEHAERFGLSALHQLRGRVGRGSEQSYCFLMYSSPGENSLSAAAEALTDDGKARLKVMLESSDGFVIAEEDLKLRGPGQIAGTEQSGYLSLGIADPVRDAAELEKARADAFAILETDPSLLLPEHQCIAGVLKKAPPFGEVAL
jgi:ATP-dependent DNA helicase RecG